MVIAGLQTILTTSIAVSATLAALAGVVMLERIFHDKLKELFNDKTYFLFFFMVTGYLLYSLGEVALYMTEVVMKKQSFPGIPDVYWVGGGIFILVSFIALAFQLMKEHYTHGKFSSMILFAVLLVAVVITLLFTITLGPKAHFLNYFYPIVSSLIVAFGLSVVFFSSKLDHFGSALSLFFLASCCILLADIFYTSVVASGGYGLSGIIADVAYLAGYFLSFLAFVSMRLKVHSLSQ